MSGYPKLADILYTTPGSLKAGQIVAFRFVRSTEGQPTVVRWEYVVLRDFNWRAAMKTLYERGLRIPLILDDLVDTGLLAERSAPLDIWLGSE